MFFPFQYTLCATIPSSNMCADILGSTNHRTSGTNKVANTVETKKEKKNRKGTGKVASRGPAGRNSSSWGGCLSGHGALSALACLTSMGNYRSLCRLSLSSSLFPPYWVESDSEQAGKRHLIAELQDGSLQPSWHDVILAFSPSFKISAANMSYCFPRYPLSDSKNSSPAGSFAKALMLTFTVLGVGEGLSCCAAYVQRT